MGPRGTIDNLWEPQRNVGAQWLMTVERNAGRFSLGACGGKLLVDAELLKVAKPWLSAFYSKMLYLPRYVRDLRDQIPTFS